MERQCVFPLLFFLLLPFLAPSLFSFFSFFSLNSSLRNSPFPPSLLFQSTSKFLPLRTLSRLLSQSMAGRAKNFFSSFIALSVFLGRFIGRKWLICFAPETSINSIPQHARKFQGGSDVDGGDEEKGMRILFLFFPPFFNEKGEEKKRNRKKRKKKGRVPA